MITKINGNAIGQSTYCTQVVNYVCIIDEAYNGLLNYDNACVAYNQYMSTGQTSDLLLQKAWGYLNSIPLHFPSAQDLAKVILAEANVKGITL